MTYKTQDEINLKIMRSICKDNEEQDEICTDCLASSMLIPNCIKCEYYLKGVK